ncbi:MAG: hypothetical protein Kow0059_04940 [Candidatus Sumerlaeia bacterium]
MLLWKHSGKALRLNNERLLWTPAETPAPLDQAAWFGRQAPLGLDLGCGTGRFLVRMAARHPGWNWLGVEQSLKYARISAWKIERAGLAHARVLCAGARGVLGALLPPGSASAAFVLFADPWFKKRHLKRRLIDSGFAAALARALRPGAPLHIKTDIADYHRQILTAFAGSPHFRPLPPEEAFTLAPAWDGILTNYERKALAAGRRIYYLGFIRNEKDGGCS